LHLLHQVVARLDVAVRARVAALVGVAADLGDRRADHVGGDRRGGLVGLREQRALGGGGGGSGGSLGRRRLSGLAGKGSGGDQQGGRERAAAFDAKLGHRWVSS